MERCACRLAFSKNTCFVMLFVTDGIFTLPQQTVNLDGRLPSTWFDVCVLWFMN
jgi:hypothetical protein